MTLQDDTSVTLTLDLKGLLCPLPVVKMAKAIKEIEVGQVIEASATDPGVMVDIPAWCKSTKNELLAIDKEDDHFLFRVRRSQRPE
jgi:tRNA 2-thiouridine synthesizing protein A